MKSIAVVSALLGAAQAYFLVGNKNFLTTERLDPIINPGAVSGHTHSVIGGSNFRATTNTAALRQSECTTMPIKQDKSNYWFPHLYFQWKNGSFSSLNGGVVVYYLFSDEAGKTTPFPDDFRMISGDPTLRSYDESSYAQQAVSFLCLDFNGQTTRYTGLPNKACPSGVRAQINFPSCWDGKNTDSADHKSHVAFLSGGPDSGTCSDPKFPITLPRIFMEVYWDTGSWNDIRDQAMTPDQPFVYAYGDRTGYGYHADFIMGWEQGVLQNVVDKCHCNIYGDATCCAQMGLFDLDQESKCHLTRGVNEIATGTLAKLPGNNPVVEAGARAAMQADPNPPSLLSPVYVYTSDTTNLIGNPVKAGSSPAVPSSVASSAPSTSKAASPSTSKAASPSTSEATSPSTSKAASPSTNEDLPVPSSSAASAPSPVTSEASSSPAPEAPASTTASSAAASSSSTSSGSHDHGHHGHHHGKPGNNAVVGGGKGNSTCSGKHQKREESLHEHKRAHRSMRRSRHALSRFTESNVEAL